MAYLKVNELMHPVIFMKGNKSFYKHVLISLQRFYSKNQDQIKNVQSIKGTLKRSRSYTEPSYSNSFSELKFDLGKNKAPSSYYNKSYNKDNINKSENYSRYDVLKSDLNDETKIYDPKKCLSYMKTHNVPNSIKFIAVKNTASEKRKTNQYMTKIQSSPRMYHTTNTTLNLTDPIRSIQDDLLKINKSVKDLLRVRKPTTEHSSDNQSKSSSDSNTSLPDLENYSKNNNIRNIVYDSRNNKYYPAYMGGNQKNQIKFLNLKLMPINKEAPINKKTEKSLPVKSPPVKINVKEESKNDNEIFNNESIYNFKNFPEMFRLKKDMITFNCNSRNEIYRRCSNLQKKTTAQLPFKVESPFDMIKEMSSMSTGLNLYNVDLVETNKYNSMENDYKKSSPEIKNVCFLPRRIKRKITAEPLQL